MNGKIVENFEQNSTQLKIQIKERMVNNQDQKE